MTYKNAFRLVVLAVLLALTTPLLGCPTQQKSPVEKLSDSTQDALDMRENEKLKDAGENVEDAVNDAGEAVKEAAE